MSCDFQLSLPIVLGLTIEQGATFRQPFRFREKDGTYRNMTVYTAKFYAVNQDGSEFLTLDSADDEILLTADGYVTVIVPAAVTADMEPDAGREYNLDLTDEAGEVTRLAKGPLQVAAAVPHPTA